MLKNFCLEFLTFANDVATRKNLFFFKFERQIDNILWFNSSQFFKKCIM